MSTITDVHSGGGTHQLRTAVKILQIHTSSAARPQVISMTSGQTVKNVHTLLLLFDFQWHKLMV